LNFLSRIFGIILENYWGEDDYWKGEEELFLPQLSSNPFSMDTTITIVDMNVAINTLSTSEVNCGIDFKNFLRTLLSLISGEFG